MPFHPHVEPDAVSDIFSVEEIASAAGVTTREVYELIGTRVGAGTEYLNASDAVGCVRRLRRGCPRALFAPARAARRSPGAGIAAAGALHLSIAGILVLLTTLGLAAPEAQQARRLEPVRLVFLAVPGPGGGGGGGGLKKPAPPARAALKMAAPFKSPVPPPRRLTTRPPASRVASRPEPILARPRPAEPPPPPTPVVSPQVVAPVPTAADDDRDRGGVIDAPIEGSQGRGAGGGAGDGRGTGMGEGTGAGIGPGSGGGTGGGPYRPGSGITPPRLLREVKPAYTDDARRMSIEGDVVLEIVVRADGSVGEIRVLRSLGGGLERRAADAVRQWAFAPATRLGSPVDVVVEVAVEFKLR